MTVYIVTNCDYDDNEIWEVFDNEESANEYRDYWASRRSDCRQGPKYPSIEIWDVESRFERLS